MGFQLLTQYLRLGVCYSFSIKALTMSSPNLSSINEMTQKASFIVSQLELASCIWRNHHSEKSLCGEFVMRIDIRIRISNV
ncbi:hypothetical protein H5410_057932 [Solanum commersonii]|uniref:Uncharacterized protein n=1 Tax=Solanum commersonii TaxID=4109 RepID=A0A9J5WS79_SOLCO|nr:hypothetical protein H5410_057932 [Solanum commersonii]